MKKKLAFFPALALAAALCLLSACGPKEDGRVTLTLMGKKTDLAKNYMTRIFEQYEKETGNELEILAYEDEEFEEAAAKKAEEGDLPDLMMHFNNSDLEILQPEEHFYCMDGESWIDSLTPAAKAYCENPKGKIFGLPFWEMSVSGCYYNKTLLDSLGLKPASTQKEFDVLCQALADIGQTPICWPADGCGWMYQFGLDPVFADDPERLDKLNRNEASYADVPEVADMLEWLLGASARGWFGDSYMDIGWSDISPSINSGETAMVFIWDTWFYTDFEEGKYTRDDFALMPVFMGTAEDGTYEGGNLNMLMARKDGEHLEEALGFLEFCADPDHYNAAFRGVATESVFQGQTTNIESDMVLDAEESVKEKQRVSTAEPGIVGYHTQDVCNAVTELMAGKTDVEGCIRLLDEYRVKEAKRQGAKGF